MSKAAEAFPDLAADLIEVIFVVRDDIESKAALKSKKGIVIPIWFFNTSSKNYFKTTISQKRVQQNKY